MDLEIPTFSVQDIIHNREGPNEKEVSCSNLKSIRIKFRERVAKPE